MAIDTEALLMGVDIVALVRERVELKKAGKEWTGLCPFHGDKHAGSFTVSPQKQFYHCFACGASGDAIDWRMFTDGVGFVEACRRLGSGLSSQRKVRESPPERVTGKPPAGTPPPDLKSVRWGKPTKVWTYCDSDGEPLGLVARYEYEEDGKLKKLTPQWTWGTRDEGKTWGWGMGHWTPPRPLYGLDRLAARPMAPVLVVEGEKCADAATGLFPQYVCVTWPGGALAVDMADWAPLAGRSVLLWPDADSQLYPQGHERAGQVKDYAEQPGVMAMTRVADLLVGSAKRVRILDVSDHAEGWDVADAVEEGWDHARAMAWAKAQVLEYSAAAPDPPPPPEPGEPPAPEPEEPPKRKRSLTLTKGGAEPAARVDIPAGWMSWETLQLDLNGKGLPYVNLDNATRVLLNHADMQGKFWYDEFHQKVLVGGAPGERGKELGDADVLEISKWMQQALGLRAFGDELVRKAVAMVAQRDVRSEPRDWMDTLVWDEMPRLFRFFPEYFGSKDTSYTRAASQNFLRSAVVRVYKPDEKVDTMPILEGPQGIYKSQAVKLLGRPWSAVTHEQVTSKDFFVALQGVLIMEIDEFESFSRADAARIKGVVSTQVDRFRTPYGRLAQNHRRRTVFVATTNEEVYLKDLTGARRFWPIKCGTINLEALERDRDQLWAEAVAEVKAGARWWHMPGEAREEQEDRRARDAWEDVIRRYVDQRRVRPTPESEWAWVDREHPLRQATTLDALQEALDIPPGRWTRSDQMRVAECFRGLGWKRRKTIRGWIYVRPEEEDEGA